MQSRQATSTEPSIPAQEVLRLVRHSLPMAHPCWLFPVTFKCLGMAESIILEAEVRLLGQWFLGCSSLTLRMATTLPFLSLPFFLCHDLSKMVNCFSQPSAPLGAACVIPSPVFALLAQVVPASAQHSCKPSSTLCLTIGLGDLGGLRTNPTSKI